MTAAGWIAVAVVCVLIATIAAIAIARRNAPWGGDEQDDEARGQPGGTR